jgi:hypothetical protein
MVDGWAHLLASQEKLRYSCVVGLTIFRLRCSLSLTKDAPAVVDVHSS